MVPIGFLKPDAVQTKRITITFDAPPTGIVLSQPMLRYNKTFAFHFSMDDGLIGAYRACLPLFQGGTAVFNDGSEVVSGLNTTDGCGNDLPFIAGVAVNLSTVLETLTPTAYLSRAYLRNLVAKGFVVTNHSYSNQLAGDFSVGEPARTNEILAEIRTNTDQIRDAVGIICRSFAAPSNDDVYDGPTAAMVPTDEMRVVYNIASEFKWGSEKDLEFFLSQSGFGVRRNFSTWSDPSITQDGSEWDFIDDEITEQAGLGKTPLITIGSHRVDYGTAETGFATSLRWITFKYLFEGLESRYGKSGADNMWMAPCEKIVEYHNVRDNAIVSQTIDGNNLILDFDASACWADASEHPFTFLLSANENITGIAYEGFDTTSHNINNAGDTLINAAYETPWAKAIGLRVRATVAVEEFEDLRTQALKDVANAEVALLPSGDAQALRTVLQARIDAVTVVPDSQTFQIDFGRNLPGYTLAYPWNSMTDDNGLTAGSQSLASLSSIASVNSGIGLEITVDFDGQETNVPFGSGEATLPFPYEACRDGWETPNTSGTAGQSKFKLTGLDPTKQYDFEFFGSRGSVHDDTLYTVVGATTDSAVLTVKNNVNSTATVVNIAPDGSNEIEITVEGNGNYRGYINAVEIIEHA